MRVRMLLNRHLRVHLTAKFRVRVANRLFPRTSLKFAVEPSGGAAWFYCLSLNRSLTFGSAVAGLKVCDRFGLVNRDVVRRCRCASWPTSASSTPPLHHVPHPRLTRLRSPENPPAPNRPFS